MNKSELVDAVSKNSGLTKSDSERAVNSLVAVLEETLGNGEDVSLVGFGIFSVKETSGRIGRDFKTGKSVDIPPRKTVRFKPGRNLKDCVN
jgi:DNA-binding protein HU-beta